MTEPLQFDARVTWYPDPSRIRPAIGTTHATVARFADDPPDELFSVVLEILPGVRAHGDAPYPAVLHVLVPENVSEKVTRLLNGGRLVLHEGRRAVGECEVEPHAALADHE